MQDGAPETPVDAKQGVIGRLLLRFSELFAYIGGGIFIFLVVMYRCGLFISRAMAPAQEALHD
jgi:hypothetical protein